MGFFRRLFCLGPKKEAGAKDNGRGPRRIEKPQPHLQHYELARHNEAQPAQSYHNPQADGYLNTSVQHTVDAKTYSSESYQPPPIGHHNQRFSSENTAEFAQADGHNAQWNTAQPNNNMFIIPEGVPGSVWSETPEQFSSRPSRDQLRIHPEVNDAHQQHVRQLYGQQAMPGYATEQYPGPMQYVPSAQGRSPSPRRSYSPSRRPSTALSDPYQVSGNEQQPEGEFFGTLEPREPDSEPPDLTHRIIGMSNVPHFNGTYSDVHKGQLRNNSRGEPQHIAIKVLKRVGDLGVMRRKFRREQQIWWGLVHPNIIPLLGYADFSNFGSLISPWCIHGDVTQYLSNARLYIDQRVQIWKGVARGIDYLHSHDPPVIHGDLKPANVLIDATGTPMVCDFGLSRAPREDGKHGGNTTTSAYHGTVRYVPRELIDGVSPFYTPHPTKESDVHALGCIGFEVIYLAKPYAHRSVEAERTSFNLGADILRGIPPARRPSETVNPELWNWLEACWEVDPSTRPEVRPLAIWLCLPPWIVPEDYDVPVVD